MGSQTYAGAISGTGAVTKIGAGTQTLSGSNTYSGATMVTGGTLTLSGSGAINSSSGITINGGAAKFLQNSSVAGTSAITLTNNTLIGSGAMGAVTVGSGTGGIVANGNGVSGNTSILTMNALTFSGAGTINLQLAGGVITTEGLTVSNALNTSGVTSSVTINLPVPTTPFSSASTTYKLIGYGTFSGSLTDFAVGTGLTNRQSSQFGNAGGFITLTIAGDAPKWSGLDSNNWVLGSTGGSSNWKLITGGAATNFLVGDAVLFNDSATLATGTVNISSANVSPFGTIFDNTTKAYTITGGFGIATGTLAKTGTGQLTILNANSYTGATTVNAGMLRIDLFNAGGLGTGTVTVNGGDLLFGSGMTLANNFVLSGGGIYGRDNTNTIAGTLTINAGSTTSYLGETYDSKTLNISGQVSGSGDVTLAHPSVIDPPFRETTSTSVTGTSALTTAQSRSFGIMPPIPLPPSFSMRPTRWPARRSMSATPRAIKTTASPGSPLSSATASRRRQ